MIIATIYQYIFWFIKFKTIWHLLRQELQSSRNFEEHIHFIFPQYPQSFNDGKIVLTIIQYSIFKSIWFLKIGSAIFFELKNKKQNLPTIQIKAIRQMNQITMRLIFSKKKWSWVYQRFKFFYFFNGPFKIKKLI